MCDIHHHIDTEVGADGAWSCLATVGDTEHVADEGNRIFSFEDEGDDGSGLHEFLDLWVERLIGDVSIMFAENYGIQIHHLASADRKACFLEACDDLATELLRDGVGLEENEGAFHGNE